jgi:hypothetical protein
MTRYDSTPRRAAGMAALIAATGLALAGCSGSLSVSGSASPAAGSSSPAAPGGTQAGIFFPVGVGNTWVYTTGSAGQGGATVTNKMTAVTPVATGQQVTMSVAAGALAPASVTYVFHPDGSITVPVTQFASGAIQLSSGSILWPSRAQLASGQPHSSTVTFTLKIAGQPIHVTANVTVQGGGTQAVTVPAGTYQAQVINETFSESVAGKPVKVTLQTWVANGVGPVKTALTSSTSSSGPGTVEVLKSFTKG